MERLNSSDTSEKYKYKNLFLAAGVVSLFVSVPVGLLFLGVGGYQHLKSKDSGK